MANRWKHLAIAIAATTSLVAVPAIATADGGDVGPRLELACARADSLNLRTQRLVHLVESGPEVQGSLAWLQTQIDRAVAAGRPQLALVLQNRLDVRTAKLQLLKVRLDRLAKIDTICARFGL